MSSERRLGLDVLKGVAIVMVVFNHALVWPMREGDLPSAFAYGTAFWTVAAFSAVAGYVQGFHPPREERMVVHKRAGQLLVPWALWAPLYALFPLAWRWCGGGGLPIAIDPGPWARGILLGGGPLWFLPVLFATTAVCALLDTRTERWWPFWGAVALYAAVATVAAVAGTSPLEVGGGTFWPVAPLYVAAFWYGLRMSRNGLPRRRPGVWMALMAGSMVASGVVTLLRAIQPDAVWLMWLPYAIGLVGGCAGLLIAASKTAGGASAPDRAHRLRELSARMGQASLGIYILHPLVAGPLALVVSGRGGVLLTAGISLLAVAIATVIVERLRLVPGVRRFV